MYTSNMYVFSINEFFIITFSSNKISTTFIVSVKWACVMKVSKGV